MSKPRITSKFSDDTCRDILNRVDGSQTGITNTTAQLVFWKRHASEVVRCWEQVFQRADMEKRMNLIYLANDVVQTSRKTGREFTEAYHKALPEAFRHMLKHSDEQAQRKLKKLVLVWRDRKVWGNKATALYLNMVRGVASDEPAASSEEPDTKFLRPEPFGALLRVLNAAHSSMLEVHRLSEVEARAQQQLNALQGTQTGDDQYRASLEAAVSAGHELLLAVEQHVSAQQAAQSELEKVRNAKAADVERTIAKAQMLRGQQIQQQATLRALGSSIKVEGVPSNLLCANMPASAPDLMGGHSQLAPVGHLSSGATASRGATWHGQEALPGDVPKPSAGRRDPRAAAYSPGASRPVGAPSSPDVDQGSIVSASVYPPISGQALTGASHEMGGLSAPQEIAVQGAGVSMENSAIGQLANMDPSESAALLSSILNDAPADMKEQFGDALRQQLSTV